MLVTYHLGERKRERERDRKKKNRIVISERKEEDYRALLRFNFAFIVINALIHQGSTQCYRVDVSFGISSIDLL